MAKQLNINLAFTADTGKAKAAIEDLSKSLQNVAKMPGNASSLFDDRDIKKASAAALELERHLEKAVNVNTGKLDLSRFSISLKAAGKNLDKYYDDLLKIGPAGQDAFLKMAQAVATAETPIIRVNKRLEEMGTVLKNTVRWQISSSILHGFMGSVQSAYHYAQDLNESLNNIRIVTGASADEMSKFAVEANRAARELSTTTNEYAKASLIYYQQGLKDNEVKERSDVTIKMANVARESAETVSDQMTAVWNNFAKGGENLEYFADVMTALGAATASSTAEISEGLNKFAAIADTVGLSYEYSTAALATVTSTTRQSADIVGTAFKTMFARIQGLKLGETLEDGTTLNKYSEALMKVGIDIKDQNGELKDMDNILDEMAAKWESMEKDRQVALAQTVAGTRQYTQLVALMDNWDFMEENLEVAKNAEGALDEQAEIYAESWEAASDRVRAAMESVYTDLIDDDFFITVLNGVEKLVEGIHGITDGLGGMKGIAALTGSIFMNLYAKKMPEAMENLKANFMVFTGQSDKLMKDVQNKTISKLSNSMIPGDDIHNIKAQSIIKLTELQQKYSILSKDMTTLEQKDAEARMENVKSIYEEITALKEKNIELQKLRKKENIELAKAGERGARKLYGQYNASVDKESNLSKQLQQETNILSDLDEDDIGYAAQESKVKVLNEELVKAQLESEALDEKITKLWKSFKDARPAFEEMGTNISGMDEAQTTRKLSSAGQKELELAISKTTNKLQEQYLQYTKLSSLSESISGQSKHWTENAEAIGKNEQEVKKLKEIMSNYVNIIKQNYLNLLDNNSQNIATQAVQNFNKTLEEGPQSADKFSIAFQDLTKQLLPLLKEGLDSASNDITTFEEQLESLDIPEEKIQELRRLLGEFSDNELSAAIKGENVKNIDLDPPAFEASKAFSELNATLMATYSLVTTLQSAFKTFGDENSSSWEKMGAALSVVIALTEGYNSVQSLTKTLIESSTVETLGLSIANSKLGVALTGATTATLSLKAAMIEFVAIGLAIAGVIALFDSMVTSVAEARKTLEELHGDTEDAIASLESLNTELKEIQDRIAELSGKKTLTIAEESELIRLQAMEASLQNQQKIAEKMAKDKAIAENASIKDSWETTNDTGETPTRTEYDGDIYRVRHIDFDEFSNYELNEFQEKNKDKFQPAEEDYSNYIKNAELIGGPRDDEYLDQAQETLRQYRIAEFRDDYSKTFLDPILSTLNVSVKDIRNGNEEVWKKYQTIFDAAGINIQDFSKYVNEKNAKVETLLGDNADQLNTLNSKELAILYENLDALSNWNPQTMSLKDYISGFAEDVDESTEKIEELDEELMSLSEMLTKVKEIAENISLGKIIKREDYDTLVDYNQELAKYFMILADGSAQFIGDPLDFQQELKSIEQNRLKDEISNNQAWLGETSAERASAKIASKQKGQASAVLLDTAETEEDAFSAMGWDPEKEQIYQGVKAQTQASQIDLALTTDSAKERQELLDDNLINQDAANIAFQRDSMSEKWEGMDPKEVEDYADSLIEAAEASEELGGSSSLLSEDLKDGSKDAKEAAEDVALYTKKMNKGINTLADNYKDWNNILKKSDSASEEYAQAMSGMKEAVSDVLGVSEEFLSNDFILKAENMELIEKAAQGDAEAIDALAIAASKDILMRIDIQDDGLREEALSLHEDLVAQLPEIKVGAILDDEDFLNTAQDIINAAGMTAEQANAYFGAMGFETNFVTEPQPQTQHIPIYVTETVNEGSHEDENGVFWQRTRTRTYQDGTYDAEGSIDAIAMATSPDGSKVPQIKSLTRRSSGAMNNYSSSNSGGRSPGKKSGGGGGGGSKKKPKKAKEVKKDDIVERYKEIDDSLDDIAETLDDINQQQDRLYGMSRIKQMEKANKALEEEIRLNKQKKKLAEEYLDIDKRSLDKAAKDAGIAFKYDEKNHNITNYTEQMTILYDELKALIDQANADGDVSEEEQEAIDKKQEEISKVKDAASQYDDTKELIEDIDNKNDDNYYQIHDNNAEMLNYKLEVELELNESDLKLLDYYLNKLSDDFYSSAEGLALLKDKMAIYQNNIELLNKHQEALEEQYAAGEISQEDYIEGMQKDQDAIIENLDALNELDRAMCNYYGDTVQKAQEELDKYTDKMERQTKMLEHYQNVLSIIGKEQDYERMGVILEGQAKTIRNEMEVAEQEVAMFQAEAEKKKALYDAAIESGDEAAAEVYKKEWEAAEQAAAEAQDNMLEKTEAWAEAMRAVMENKLAGMAQSLENTLTGGTSFDQINTQLERARNLQEEYLTTTNKIYETNKLMNTAQKEIDKSSNTVAKRKLNEFVKETKSLQEKNKLSKFELDIQKAKYDLLLAEIALEDAQNTQSMVRLQKDSEGNFGYVYTADSNKIAEAEQNLADAQNNLYNIGLEGANRYTEKYYQTMNEMYDTLTDLQQRYLNGEFETEEEYQNAVLAAKEYYYAQLENYSELYQIATGVDSRIVEDAWSTSFSGVVQSTEEWKTAVDEYLGNVTTAFQEWADVVQQISNETIGPDLESLKTKVDDITKASDDLKDSIVKEGGVIDSLQAEMDAVSELTQEYAEMREAILKAIEAQEQLLEQNQDKIEEEVHKEEPTNPEVPPSQQEPEPEVQEEPEALKEPEKLKEPSAKPKILNQGDHVVVKKTATNFSRDGGNGTNMQSWVPGSSFTASQIDGNEVLLWNSERQGYTGWVYKHDLEGFRTGGYTGEWGPEGKLAMLHEKELVLNKEDTSNLLLGLETLKDIMHTIDLQAGYEKLRNLFVQNFSAIKGAATEALEQKVTIEANFPNVIDKNEIEAAFENLVNQASQYANRK